MYIPLSETSKAPVDISYYKQRNSCAHTRRDPNFWNEAEISLGHSTAIVKKT